MANTTAEMQIGTDAVPSKRGKNRKAIKLKAISSNETNILAGQISQSSPSPIQSSSDAGKENQERASKTRSPKKTRAAPKSKGSKKSFEKELQEMQEQLGQLRLEKEQTQELLKERDQMLKQKEEELETQGRDHEKLQLQLKKLQKLKEFKPTVTFPLVQSLRDMKHEKNENNKKKDFPEKKRPSPAYVLWCKDQWVEVKKENPDADFKEISNILGTKWKNTSAEEKRPYEERYQAEKEAYLQIVKKEKREKEAMKLLEEEQKQKTAMELLEQYLQFKQFSQEAEKENKKTRKEKDPEKPKQPLSAFFLYSKERRVSLLEENKNVLEAARIAGQEWKSMAEEQRASYEEIARKHKEEYMREMELYKQKKDEEAATLQKKEEHHMKIQKQEALQLLRKKERTENMIKKTKENHQRKKKQKDEQNRDPKKPKKPASSFLLFSKETRTVLLQEQPGINNSTLNAMISVKWKELGEAEKQIWNKQAANAMEEYKKELEEYNKSIMVVDHNA